MKNNFVLYILVIISLVLSLFNSALLIKNVIPSNTTNTAATSDSSSASYDDMVGTWYSPESNFIVVKEDGTVYMIALGREYDETVYASIERGYFANGHLVLTEDASTYDYSLSKHFSFDELVFNPYGYSYEMAIIDKDAFKILHSDFSPDTYIRLSDESSIEPSVLGELSNYSN